MVFVVDDLGAWLVGLLADASLKKLTTLLFGSEQDRALRQAAAAAVQQTVEEWSPAGGERAGQLAAAITKAFKTPMPKAVPVGNMTLLEVLQSGIAERLAVLDEASLAGARQSPADLLGVSAAVLAEQLGSHLVREIMIRGSRGGPLTPLADQLNHDQEYLQGQRLEGMLARLAEAVRAGRAPAVVSQAMRLLPRPAYLYGREGLLADLDVRLAEADEHRPRVVALCGMGGAGKTSVALEYTYRDLDGLWVAWQLAAEEPMVLKAGFGDLAAQLSARDPLADGDPVAQVHGVLAARPGDWLLIFDNAPGPAALRHVLPPKGRGRVLITSQNPNWPGAQAVEVLKLGQDVAATFLQARTGSADEDAALKLAGELDGLPLALEQAAAYMRVMGCGISHYLGLFRERRAELMARGDEELVGYDKQVTTTWALAFAEVGQSGPASGLLRLVACCAAENIPLHLLLQPRPGLAAAVAAEVAPLLVPLLEDALARGDAVAGLRRYSLISAPHDGLVSVHRLVQAITLDEMPADLAAAWQQATAAVIEAALPEDPDHPANWQAFAALLPHAQKALAPASYGSDQITTYLRAIGNYGAAIDLQGQILDACQASLGDKNPRTLTARARLATLTGEAGDPVAARDQSAALVPVMTQVLGAEHPDTLAARASLAYWTGEAGDRATARDQYAALMTVMTQVLDAEHPVRLAALSNLTRLTGDTGNPVAARNRFAELLPIWEQLSGAEHPDTLAARASLAYWTGEAGDPAAARDQYAQLLPVRERVLGDENPRTLTTRGNLARWTGEAGDPAAARDQYAQLLPVLERVLGDQHPDTLAARRNLAYWKRQAQNSG